MALQLAWTDPITQVSAPTAYARVVSIVVDAVYLTVDLGIGLYATAAAREAGAPPFSMYHAWPDYESLLGTTVDVRAASYAFLKTLDAFAGAVDA